MKQLLYLGILIFGSLACQEIPPTTDDQERYEMRGWNILSSHHSNGMRTIDTAAVYGANYIELSHYQLCHFLKDLRNEKNRSAVNTLAKEAHESGIEKVFLWDHAFYEMDYYPNKFKVPADTTEDFKHHAKHFEGGVHEQLNLDDPTFWQWVYQDYDSLLALAPGIDGITLTFIETGTYVIYQHSERLKTNGEKIAALVDSLAGYFIDQKGLDLTIRTFIYNQFEKEAILDAMQRIRHPGIRVMMKMVPHDWFMTYPYQDFVEEIPFPVIIEYDGGMEYAGENIIANPFVQYFRDAFLHYHQYDNVVGYCIRADRFEETTAVGTPGEINFYTLSSLVEDPTLTADEITTNFLRKNYGPETVQWLQPAFDSAWNGIMASMYTLGLHQANHSRLNLHRQNIYQTHTTGEWYRPDDQMRFVKHGVNKWYHNYKDVVNGLAFPAHKADTTALFRDLAWVVDSNWLVPREQFTVELFEDMLTEKQYAIDLAQQNLTMVEHALPYIKDPQIAQDLFHIFERTLLFTKERKAVLQAVFGYRLWCKDEALQTKALLQLIWEGLEQGDSLITAMENYPVHVPLGQWRWHRDREAFDYYVQSITKDGWESIGLQREILPPLQ